MKQFKVLVNAVLFAVGSVASLHAQIAVNPRSFPNPNPAASTSGIGNPSQLLRMIRTDFQTHVIQFSPTLAYTLGMKPREAKLPDLSPASLKAQSSYFATLKIQLEEFAGQEALLSSREKLDLAQLRSGVEYQLHWLNDWKGSLREFGNAAAGQLPSNITQEQLYKMTPQTAAEGWTEVADRLEGIDRYLTQHADNLRQGLAMGFRPNRGILEAEINAGVESANFFAEDLLVKARETLPPSIFSSMESRLHSIAQKSEKAYRSYAEFLKTELAPHAGETFAIGEKEYAWRLRQMGIAQSPDELHQQGIELAQRIRVRMDEIASQINPNKSLPEIMDEIKADHPKDDRELFSRYEEVTARAQKFVNEKGLFALPKDYRLKIIETPASLQATVSKAAYFPAPPFDPSESSAFMVTPTKGDVKKLQFHNHATIPSVAVHEAFPGHDLQFYSFQHSGNDVPVMPFLLHNGFGYAAALNIEGYALYAEELMRKLGFFNIKEELAQLQMQLWRAYRIVVDTGMHVGKMSFNEVVKILENQVFLTLPAAKAEASRYSTVPTQAITYMIGRLQTEQLKREYQSVMGPYFDEKEFHRTLFEFGPVPPATIAPVMIEEARAKRAAFDKMAQLQS